MKTKQHNAGRRGHETPLPRLVTIPTMTPRAQIARKRALAFLTKDGIHPYSLQNRIRAGGF